MYIYIYIHIVILLSCFFQNARPNMCKANMYPEWSKRRDGMVFHEKTRADLSIQNDPSKYVFRSRILWSKMIHNNTWSKIGYHWRNSKTMSSCWRKEKLKQRNVLTGQKLITSRRAESRCFPNLDVHRSVCCLKDVFRCMILGCKNMLLLCNNHQQPPKR
jgi:hypothetical protein